ncbi:MAG: alpha/beta hydrolase [Pseudomonadales bacterium]|jgi:acetyl esterase/lipase|nr:alpha/beta hydrolase [Pseudomonadales bacterium]
MTRSTLILLGLIVLGGCTTLQNGTEVNTDIVYVERSSGDLTGSLFLPAGEGPHPAVLVIHGGGWRKGEPWHMGHVSRLLANEGFVAFTPSYRFTPEHQHPAQLDDVRDAYRWLAARDDVDADDVAIWGYSAGAHLALLLGLAPEEAGGLAAEERPVAIIGGGSPTSFELFDPESRLVVQLVGGSLDERPEAWEAASPISWVSSDDPPVYLYHGSLDQIVDVEHARQLASALQEAEVPVTLDTVMGGHISVAVFDRSVERRAAAWLEQHLSDSTGMFDMLPPTKDGP